MGKWPEWKPIETAPKDGTWIIAWDGEAVIPACWEDNTEWGDKGDIGWCYGDSRWGGVLYDGINLMNPQPTHWLPLPPAPEGGE